MTYTQTHQYTKDDKNNTAQYISYKELPVVVEESSPSPSSSDPDCDVQLSPYPPTTTELPNTELRSGIEYLLLFTLVVIGAVEVSIDSRLPPVFLLFAETEESKDFLISES